MESEEELRNFLIKDMKLPFGQGFKFSRQWFNKYHNERTEMLNSEFQSPLREKKPSHINSGKVATEELHDKIELRSSLYGTQADLKNEHPSQTESPAYGTQVTDAESKDITTFKTQAQKRKEDGIKSTNGKESKESCTAENTSESTSTLNSSGSYLKEGLLEKQKSASFQEPQETFSQAKVICGAEDRNKESGNTCALEESSQTTLDIQEADANVQDGMTAADISEEPEYVQKELPSPSALISEPKVTTKCYDGHYVISAREMKTSQMGFLENDDQVTNLKASDCQEEGTDENVALLDTGKKMDLNNNKVKDYNGVPIRDCQEEMASQNSSAASTRSRLQNVADPTTNERKASVNYDQHQVNSSTSTAWQNKDIKAKEEMLTPAEEKAGGNCLVDSNGTHDETATNVGSQLSKLPRKEVDFRTTKAVTKSVAKSRGKEEKQRKKEKATNRAESAETPNATKDKKDAKEELSSSKVQTVMDFNQPVAAEDRSAKDELIETVIDPELENTTVIHTEGLSSLDSDVVVTFKSAPEKDGEECSSERGQEVPQKTAACKGASLKNVPSVSSGGEIRSPHIKAEANAITEKQAGAGGTQSSSKMLQDATQGLVESQEETPSTKKGLCWTLRKTENWSSNRL